MIPIHDPGIVAHPLELPRQTPKRPFSLLYINIVTLVISHKIFELVLSFNSNNKTTATIREKKKPGPLRLGEKVWSGQKVKEAHR